MPSAQPDDDYHGACRVIATGHLTSTRACHTPHLSMMTAVDIPASAAGG